MGTLEILIVLLVAFIFLGPQRMVDAARLIGKASREIRRMSDELPSLIEDGARSGSSKSAGPKASDEDADGGTEQDEGAPWHFVPRVGRMKGRPKVRPSRERRQAANRRAPAGAPTASDLVGRGCARLHGGGLRIPPAYPLVSDEARPGLREHTQPETDIYGPHRVHRCCDEGLTTVRPRFALPFVLYQVVRFVAPGLSARSGGTCMDWRPRPRSPSSSAPSSDTGYSFRPRSSSC